MGETNWGRIEIEDYRDVCESLTTQLEKSRAERSRLSDLAREWENDWCKKNEQCTALKAEIERLKEWVAIAEDYIPKEGVNSYLEEIKRWKGGN